VLGNAYLSTGAPESTDFAMDFFCRLLSFKVRCHTKLRTTTPPPLAALAKMLALSASIMVQYIVCFVEPVPFISDYLGAQLGSFL